MIFITNDFNLTHPDISDYIAVHVVIKITSCYNVITKRNSLINFSQSSCIENKPFLKGESPMLDYRYETFIALTEALNYTKAAKKLNLSQPAVTKHIQYLENHLGVRLVEYYDNQLKITSNGLYLKKQLHKIMTDIEVTKNNFTANLTDKTLTVGASRTIGEYFIWDKIKDFQNNNAYTVKLTVDNTTQLLSQLDKREIDLALISGPFDHKDYDSLAFLTHDIICVCGPSHPLKDQTVKLSALAQEMIFIREEGSGVLALLKEALTSLRLTTQHFPFQMTIGNIHLIKNLVTHNEGISFLYRMSVAKELAAGELHQITIENCSPTCEFKIVQKKNSEYTVIINKFKQLLST